MPLSINMQDFFMAARDAFLDFQLNSSSWEVYLSINENENQQHQQLVENKGNGESLAEQILEHVTEGDRLWLNEIIK